MGKIRTQALSENWETKFHSQCRKFSDFLWQFSDGSSGGTWKPPPPLFLDQTDSRRAEKIFFWWPSPPPLSKGLGDRPPLYLKVWIRHCNGKINLNFQDRKRRNKGFESCYSLFSLVVVNIKDITRFPLSGDFKGTRVWPPSLATIHVQRNGGITERYSRKVWI